ncbi:MAG: 2-oxo-4-hydroxy-4-carboxy-5-ureidoimidazoline decarboxylase, partial [Microcystis sp. LE19-4.1E]|nr:2-oxo-4-hydroxy-4-carboxy-5-ureidoimidazoline decarboxylase [Microcystis sp. LE19-4.1E]
VATRLDIARHWVMTHAPTGGWKPSTMPKALFMARFGGVFEHSPWVAEKAWSSGLTSLHDSATGLHQAMTRQMRVGSEAERRSLINAHPDLAGKLAQAKQLTADSTGEQASAGLDRLTADELARFTSLNDRYKEMFGFPFILAVKGLTKVDILANFEARLGNSAEQEFETALAQIEKIALLRLRDILPG